MEQVRDLNIEADDMQVVLSAISGVSKWHRHTSRYLAVSIFLQVRKYARSCISAHAPCRTIGTRGLFPTHSLQGKYFIRLRT